MAFDFSSNKGIATTIGFSPIVSLADEKIGAKYSILKALTNIIWAPIQNGLSNISLSANWMWPANNPGENTRLYNAVKSVSDFAIELGVNIPTGKDSLSMTQKYSNGLKVLSPGTVIISAVSEVSDINNVIKPNLLYDEKLELIYVNFCKDLNLTGSAFFQSLSSIGNNVIETKSPNEIKNIFKTIQDLIISKNLFAGHDVSSGGLITSLLEMNFPNVENGLKINLDGFKEDDLLKILFNESPGIIFQTNKNGKKKLINNNIDFISLGNTIKDRKLNIEFKNKSLNLDIDHFRDSWYHN